MKKSNKGKRWIIPFAIINVFLIENMAKAYEFSWVSDPIRLLCYAGLLCFGLIFSILHLIKKRASRKKKYRLSYEHIFNNYFDNAFRT